MALVLLRLRELEISSREGRGQRAAYDLLGCAHDPLHGPPVCSRAPDIPHCDAVGEDTLNH